jgi:hypothetical protein
MAESTARNVRTAVLLLYLSCLQSLHKKDVIPSCLFRLLNDAIEEYDELSISCPSINLLTQITDSYVRSSKIYSEDAVVDHIYHNFNIGFSTQLHETMTKVLEELFWSLGSKYNRYSNFISSCVDYVHNNVLMKTEIQVRLSVMICEIVRDKFWTPKDETVDTLLTLSNCGERSNGIVST